MRRAVQIINPLEKGFYTVTEAARLIEVGNRRRIYGWIRGYPNRNAAPLLAREYSAFNDNEELSFLDLIEIRFVEYFREQGISVRSLRKAMETSREVFKQNKPLASDRIVIKTDGKDLFVEEVLKPSAEATNDKRLWSLITRNYEMYECIRNIIMAGVEFDPRSHLANKWTPRPKEFPNIIIDPRIAYGKPIVPSNIPTIELYETWQAEEKSINAVSDWFDIPINEVQMAVEFENAMRQPREGIAA